MPTEAENREASRLWAIEQDRKAGKITDAQAAEESKPKLEIAGSKNKIEGGTGKSENGNGFSSSLKRRMDKID